MAQVIDAGNMRLFTFAFTKDDGSAGTVEGTPSVEFSDATLAEAVINSDGSGGKVKHTGAVGETTMAVRADGDLGAGVFPIVMTEVLTMNAPLGATAGSLGFGDQVPSDF